ncbi:UNKNOWN [Stylonychia lemnae]|uniref:Uncharacterized protein n=1 Tax=Stylonychia lemnae TaxID=5949 RepID=A0A078B4R8_STYLE|nr:UNKNOWN [Stylonychia lemnae]|eukprot:CDW88222.1 UNKNOWN [Stylonychia lemnae]
MKPNQVRRESNRVPLAIDTQQLLIQAQNKGEPINIKEVSSPIHLRPLLTPKAQGLKDKMLKMNPKHMSSIYQKTMSEFIQKVDTDLDKAIQNKIKGKEKEMLENMRIRFQAFKNQINILQKVIASKLYEGEIGKRLQSSEIEKEVLKNMNDEIASSNNKLRDQIKKFKVQIDILESDNKFYLDTIKQHMIQQRSSSQTFAKTSTQVSPFKNEPLNTVITQNKRMFEVNQSQLNKISPFSPNKTSQKIKELETTQADLRMYKSQSNNAGFEVKELNLKFLEFQKSESTKLQDLKFISPLNNLKLKRKEIGTQTEQILALFENQTIRSSQEMKSPKSEVITSHKQRSIASKSPDENPNQSTNNNYFKNLFFQCTKAMVHEIKQKEQALKMRKENCNNLFLTQPSNQEINVIDNNQNDVQNQNITWEQIRNKRFAHQEKLKILEMMFSDEKLIKKLYNLIFLDENKTEETYESTRVVLETPSQINRFVNQSRMTRSRMYSKSSTLFQHDDSIKSMSNKNQELLNSMIKLDSNALYSQSLISQSSVPDLFNLNKPLIKQNSSNRRTIKIQNQEDPKIQSKPQKQNQSILTRNRRDILEMKAIKHKLRKSDSSAFDDNENPRNLKFLQKISHEQAYFKRRDINFQHKNKYNL